MNFNSKYLDKNGWSFSQNQLMDIWRWLLFAKDAVWDVWLGSECSSGLTNDLLFYTMGCPIKVCFQRPFGRSLGRVETSQLIFKENHVTGFYMVWVFAGGLSEQTTAQFCFRKKPTNIVLLYIYLYYNICGRFILVGIADCQPVVLLENQFLYFLIVSILQEHSSMTAYAVRIS